MVRNWWYKVIVNVVHVQKPCLVFGAHGFADLNMTSLLTKSLLPFEGNSR